MSTRGQIAFEDEDGILHGAYIYKHSDSYPEGVLPTLKPFVAAFIRERGCDPVYMSAQLIRAFAIADQKELDAMPEEDRKLYASSRFLGWGISTVLHGNIEYLYVIKADGSIAIYTPAAGFWNEPTLANMWVFKTIKPPRRSKAAA